jgi:hypothetical protein
MGMRDGPYAPFRCSSTGLAETQSWGCPIDRVRAGANALGRTAAMASVLARSGRRIDLTGLDTQIRLLCAKALDLPPEQGCAIRTDLVLLLTELDALAGTLSLPGWQD